MMPHFLYFTEPRLCPITDTLKSPVYAVLQTLVESKFHRSKGGHDLTYIEKKFRKEERKKRRRKKPEQNGTPTIVSCQELNFKNISIVLP